MNIPSLEVIKIWLERAKKKGCTHLMVVCDTFNYEDYPIFITPDMDVRQEYENRHLKNMQEVIEIYNLNLNIEKQLKEDRAFHFYT